MAEFRQLYPWALEPVRHRIDRNAAQERAKVYRDHFRFVRAERQAEFCPPWVLGQELGWQVRSPVDVTLGPLPQIEITADAPLAEDGLRAGGMSELWVREAAAVAVDRTNWLHLYQFRGRGEGWENMFVPNGGGTVEWRQGWAVALPDTYSLLILPLEQTPELGVQTGVLPPASLRRMAEGAGFSLPISPTGAVAVTRGQPIARIVALHPDSLKE